MRETLHNTIDAARAYIERVDKGLALKHTLTVLMAVVIVVGSLPYVVGVVQAAGLATIDDFEDGDTNVETAGWSGWSGSISNGSFTATSSALRGDFSAEISQENSNSGDGITATRGSSFSPDRWEFLVQFDSLGGGQARYRLLEPGTGTPVIIVAVEADGSVSQGGQLSEGVLYNFTVYNIDWSNDEYDLLVTNVSNGNEVADGTDVGFNIAASSVDTIEMRIDDRDASATTYRFDNMQIDDSSLLHTVSGTVKDTNGNAIDNATVTVNSTNDETTTNSSGYYEFTLDNGTYELTADKDNFEPNSTTVAVSGADVNNTNITLSSQVDLRLEVPTFMWQNSTAGYEVFDDSGDNSVDVTDNATVTSSDPTNLTVNQTSQELESTSDLSFNGEITITATYDGSSVSKNVTVANKSVENLDKMQNAADMTGALWGNVPHPDTGERPGGTQQTMLLLFIALAAAIIVSRNSTSFGGFGAFVMVMVMGWFLGYVGDGLAMITVFTSLFIGLNLAANIDYSIRSG